MLKMIMHIGEMVSWLDEDHVGVVGTGRAG
jgi:hypothetical protein